MPTFTLAPSWVKIASAGSTVEVQVRAGVCNLAFSATQPGPGTYAGEVLQAGEARTYPAPPPLDLYAQALQYGQSSIDVEPIGSVVTPAPLASGTGGILGAMIGTSAIPVLSAATSLRHALLFSNQAAPGGATITLALASGPTPAAYAPGCYTLQPAGGALAYPASGYVPQDAWMATASAPNTPLTIEVH